MSTCTDPNWRKYTTHHNCPACAPMLDENGHFPGCYSNGCEATRCAEARMIREDVKAGRLR